MTLKCYTQDYSYSEFKDWAEREHQMCGGSHSTPFLGTQVGLLNVRTPLSHTRHYECAAWHMTLLSDTGVFPLYLARDYHFPHTLLAVANLPATVTEGYFPALFGGFPVSKKPYFDKDKGRRENIGVRLAFSEACIQSSRKHIDVQCQIDLQFWNIAIQDEQTRLQYNYNSLPQYWEQYQNDEDQFLSRIGMVAHVSENIAKHSRTLQELHRQLNYWSQPHNNKNWNFSPIPSIA